MGKYKSSKLLIEKGADLFHFGNQKTNPFAFIHSKKVKILIELIKQYYSAIKYKDLLRKCRNFTDNFVDFNKIDLLQKDNFCNETNNMLPNMQLDLQKEHSKFLDKKNPEQHHENLKLAIAEIECLKVSNNKNDQLMDKNNSNTPVLDNAFDNLLMSDKNFNGKVECLTTKFETTEMIIGKTGSLQLLTGITKPKQCENQSISINDKLITEDEKIKLGLNQKTSNNEIKDFNCAKNQKLDILSLHKLKTSLETKIAATKLVF